MKAVVIGWGCRDRGDDAVGLLVARRLREIAPEGVTVTEHEGDGVALVGLWEGARFVILVDAVRSGAPPGTVRRFEADEKPLPSEVAFGVSTHGVGLAEVIELARSLERLPKRLIVYGVEGARFEPGAEPTRELTQAIEQVVQSVLEELAHA
jgi:hydrogenase maturation protease